MAISNARDLVKFHEGCILESRPDAKGKWEIGYGHDIDPPPVGPEACTQEEAEEWFCADFSLAVQCASQALGVASYSVLSEPRKAALVDMTYELGKAGLLEFQRMLSAIRAADWQTASKEALNSLWAEQVPSRAQMDARIFLTGEWPNSLTTLTT